MNPRSSNDSEENRHPPEGREHEQAAVGTTVEGEVTRVEWVSYFEGASGHAVLSLGFLLVAVVLLRLDVVGVAALGIIVAYGVALNGLSIYVWDELRAYVGSVFGRDDGGADRTLTPHTVSTEMKAELLTGFTMVTGFVAFLGLAFLVLRSVGPRVAVYLSVGGLATANLAALAWTYHSSL